MYSMRDAVRSITNIYSLGRLLPVATQLTRGLSLVGAGLNTIGKIYVMFTSLQSKVILKLLCVNCQEIKL